jgi:hypothetical protein
VGTADLTLIEPLIRKQFHFIETHNAGLIVLLRISLSFMAYGCASWLFDCFAPSNDKLELDLVFAIAFGILNFFAYPISVVLEQWVNKVIDRITANKFWRSPRDF